MDELVDARVELAFGANLDIDPTNWIWSDVTGDLMPEPISITRGRQDEAAHDASSSCRFTLDNQASAYTPNHPASRWYPNVTLGTPVRVSVASERTFFTAKRNGLASTPDPAASAITGSIDVRFEAVLDDWAGIPLAGKWGARDGTYSWLLSTTADEQLMFSWSPDGTHSFPVGSGVPMPSRRHRAVRATLLADDGAGGLSVTLYTAESLAGPWTVLGDPVIAQITTTIFATDEPLRIGRIIPTQDAALDEMIRMEVRRTAAGPLVAAPDFTRPAPGASTFTDEAGRVWTVSGVASGIVARRTRFAGYIVEWAPDWPYGDLSTPDGYPGESRTSVTAAGVLRRLDQNRVTPPSAMRAELTQLYRPAPLTYWPCEEPNGSATFAPVSDGPVLTIAGEVAEGGVTDVPSSAGMPAFGAGQASGLFPAYNDTGVFSAVFLLRLPKNGVKAADTPLITLYGLGPGPAAYYSLEAQPDGRLAMRSRSALGGTLETSSFPALPFPLNGTPQLARFSVTRVGSTTSAALSIVNDDAPFGYGLSMTFKSAYNPPRGIVIGGGWWVGQPSGYADLNGTGIGHVYCDDTSTELDAPLLNATRAWLGERAGVRLRRLCAENHIPLVLTGPGSGTEPMGPQRSRSTLPDLLRECADADGGILYERRILPGLAYRTRASLYTQPPALVLDGRSGPGDLKPGFAPVLDDRGAHNDVTVTRTAGGITRATDTDHVHTHSRYDTQLDVNVATEAQLPDIAWWQVHLGTESGMRYPQVSPALTANPALLRPWLDAEIGDRIEVTGLPPQHPPGTVGLLMQGYTETLRPYRIDTDVNASPGRPWHVATTPTTPDALLWRADTAGAAITGPIGPANTTFSVRTDQGPLWITTATHRDQFPFLITINGETMRVTAITGTSSPQKFTVTRGVDGLTRSHATGSAVAVANPAPAAR
ncbi:hypothetical protein [Amycolatopsis sp. PS_44_ISF1]|uniref:hypothetical protein n=1 Tax=Amycolatopsis sp. PS_44_ISF1 TaxID=2974917 RepID=UPI0028DFF981|nr:hypothetical protein [Amycolatopsis sp. PS_44_ISF1]MDT8910884.1 hypothetical protein [Amycolatopsis sp. PS_44_ISF1]